MKSKTLWWILSGLLILSVMTACPSAPPPVEPDALVQDVPAPPPPPPPPPDDRAALAALDAAAARAEAARQLVMDFDGQTLFPSEWEAADSLYAQAGQQRRTGTIAEIQESAARYNAAADAFEAMQAQTLAQNFDNMERELVEARNAAVAAGAMVEAPELLLHADNTVMNAYEQYQANDFYAARENALNALAMYGTIAAFLEAVRIWDEIGMYVEELVPDIFLQVDDAAMGVGDKWEAGDYVGAETDAVQVLAMVSALRAGLAAYTAWDRNVDLAEELAPESLAEADAAAMEAFDRWEAGDFYGARTSAEMAALMYLRAGATAERQRALNRRANVAVRVEFNSAQVVYNQANSAYQARRMEDAARLFSESGSSFAIVAQVALERQLMAEEALRLANERMAESDEAARAAERILEGGAQ